MENKKLEVLFAAVVIAFLLVTLILIKNFKAKRANDYKQYSTTIAIKNDRIKTLTNQLSAEEKENANLKNTNADLKNTLADARNGLDTLSKKLAQPVSVVAPASVPATATATK